MKKIFIVFIMFVFLCSNAVYSAVVSLSVDGEFQEYINKTGFKILNANEIEQHIVYRYSNSESLRTYSTADDRTVYIPRGLLTYIESEDELAAIIAYQTAYCLQYYEGIFSKLTVKLSAQKYETLADKRAVDFLVKSGYCPIAMITMINKVYGQTKSNIFSQHVKTSVRLARIYEYIIRKYPDKLDDRRFKNNIYYQNFLLNSRKNRELLQNRLQHDPFSTKRIDYR